MIAHHKGEPTPRVLLLRMIVPAGIRFETGMGVVCRWRPALALTCVSVYTLTVGLRGKSMCRRHADAAAFPHRLATTLQPIRPAPEPVPVV